MLTFYQPNQVRDLSTKWSANYMMMKITVTRKTLKNDEIMTTLSNH